MAIETGDARRVSAMREIGGVPLFAFCSDIHYRDTVPRSRTDGEAYFLRQGEKLAYISKVCNNYHIPLIIAGDIGHKPEWKNWLITDFLQNFKTGGRTTYAIPGQHDIFNHKVESWNKGVLGVLDSINVIRVVGVPGGMRQLGISNTTIDFIPYGVSIPDIWEGGFYPGAKYRVLVIHKLLTSNPNSNFGVTGLSFLRQYPYYDLIISGDNHENIEADGEGRMWINPGSMMAMHADQVGHSPCLYIWCSDGAIITKPIPFHNSEKLPGILTRRHIDAIKKKGERLEVYMDRLNAVHIINKGGEEVSFEANMEVKLSNIKVKGRVKEKVWEAISDEPSK
uniref:Putative calcineurin-like phosphoesterase n=1 Tax=viral metagenome TaxID=1070528 RepID=A0A6M3LQQ4_9ZZZZ